MSSSMDVPLIAYSPPSPHSTMSPPRSPRRPNTIQALRDKEKEYRCRGCFSKCLPCVDTPATVIQKQLTEESDRESNTRDVRMNDPDRIQRDIILSTLSEFKNEPLNFLFIS